jgi:hypothetical protein
VSDQQKPAPAAAPAAQAAPAPAFPARRLTRVTFRDNVNMYPPEASGRAPSGKVLENQADAAEQKGGKFGWIIYLHFDPLGRRECVTVVHERNPQRPVEIPYEAVLSCEEHWRDDRYRNIAPLAMYGSAPTPDPQYADPPQAATPAANGSAAPKILPAIAGR